jgi:hypothetical protein
MFTLDTYICCRPSLPAKPTSNCTNDSVLCLVWYDILQQPWNVTHSMRDQYAKSSTIRAVAAKARLGRVWFRMAQVCPTVLIGTYVALSYGIYLTTSAGCAGHSIGIKADHEYIHRAPDSYSFRLTFSYRWKPYLRSDFETTISYFATS